ncbi:hypothetical protein M9H77_02732 [Catharanthus roseus]|uniref:Uncharacterized protein n=1 Tax=Catharanthus roseus TaxID=4058 RepID=A0ACC0C9D4_CATRO|nr:hypothetical protein M9H77_02732 [Catharanthus roseus]
MQKPPIAPSTQKKLKVNDFAATALELHSHAGMNCIDSTIQVAGMPGKRWDCLNQPGNAAAATGQFAAATAGPKSDAWRSSATRMGCRGAEIVKQGAGTSGNNLGNGGEGLNKHGIAVAAKGNIKGAEKALAKVQEKLKPDLPNDLETLTDEKRFLFRKIGLSMKTYLLTCNFPIPSATSFSLF